MKKEKRKKEIFGAVAAGMCLAACLTGCAVTKQEDDNHGESKKSGETQNLSVQYQKEKTVAKGEVSDAFRAAYADFSVNLLRESRAMADAEGKNTMVSPLSVMTALEMSRYGADGDTGKQMEQVLYGGMSGEEGRTDLMRFTDGLPDEKDASYIGANSIWFREAADRTPKQDFLESNGADLDADIFEASFGNDTVDAINQWVEKKTDGNVKKILDEIPEGADMYLINASSFDAEWENEYEESDILKDREFTCADGTKKNVDLMEATEREYLCGENEIGFRKAYKEGYSFVALLPNEGIGIDDYVNQLDGAAFLELMEEAQEETVYTMLPAFESDTGFELSDTLKALGMPLAFDKDQAEFPGIFEESDVPVWIGRVLQKTHICVDARGTKAGAATVVEIMTESAAQQDPDEEPKEVYLDRPFVYAIVEDDTNLPVFIGTVEDIGK